MNLSEVSIRRPVFSWMLMLGLLLFGAISFGRLGISYLPELNFPVVTIQLRFDNAAPEMMESMVVDPIEDAVMGIEGLKRVISRVSEGTANMSCEFEFNHSIQVATQEVEQRVREIGRMLPSTLYPPVITKTNSQDEPTLWVMLSSDAWVPSNQLMRYARNILKDQLSMVSGVGDVIFAGYVEPNLRVWMDQKKLKSYHLTSSDVVTAITTEQVEKPAGRIEAALTETNIRLLGEASTPKSFGSIRINTRSNSPNYKPIPLSAVAHIEESLSDVRQISRFNGKAVVGLGIIAQHGSNAVEVAQRVQQKIASLQPFLPHGFQAEVKLDQSVFVKNSVHELQMTLIYSALLTSLICLLFLGSWSSTINVLMSIPTSVVGTFIAFYFFHFTLNTFTLLGLSLAIGIIVDDSIMILENIVRHLEMGKSRMQAALDGSAEISFAALATTCAIAAIFFPVIFIQGPIGKLFYQFGLTVTVAVFLSLLEALTITPMRCARFLSSSGHHFLGQLSSQVNMIFDRLAHFYQRILKWSLDHSWLVVGVSALFFISSFFFFLKLNQELIPSQDQSMFALFLSAPPGSSIDYTDSIYQKAENYLKNIPEVQDLYTQIGNLNGNNTVYRGVIYVLLKDLEFRKKSQNQISLESQKGLQNLLPSSITVTVQDLSLTGLSHSKGLPIEFTLLSHDSEKLKAAASEFLNRLKNNPLLKDLESNFKDQAPEIHFFPLRDRAAALGVSVSTMGQEVSQLVGGYLLPQNIQYPQENHRYSIRVRGLSEQLKDLNDILKIPLNNDRGSLGEFASLNQVASYQWVSSPTFITRQNRNRMAFFSANLQESVSQHQALQEIQFESKRILKNYPEVNFELGSNLEAITNTFSSLIFAMLLGIIVAYMILASQFNSFLQPITVLMALPFSLSGALIALFYFQQSLNLYSMMGLILLMGIVKKNSILLVEFTNQMRSKGLSVSKSLLEACPVRLRPILMTSLATIVGAIPEAFNHGSGSESRIPMAITLMGGVSLSTFFTLLVVPCVYQFFARWEKV